MNNEETEMQTTFAGSPLNESLHIATNVCSAITLGDDTHEINVMETIKRRRCKKALLITL